MNRRIPLLFAAMLAAGPIVAAAQMRPPVPNRPPPSSPGTARMRAPTWNALETAEMEPLRPGGFVRVRPIPPPDPYASPPVPAFRNQYGYPMPSIGLPSGTGPATVVPRAQPPGAQAAGIPADAPWTPGAVQTYGAGPSNGTPVPSVRVPATFDPIGCPTCGGGMQQRVNAVSVGPDGRLHYEGPINPNPGGVVLPSGGLEHRWQSCVSCGTRRDEAVTARGEVNPAPQTARRADALSRMQSACPSGVCSRVIIGESQVSSHTGQTYYGTALSCIGCGSTALTVQEGTVGRTVTARDGQQVQQGPVRAVGTPGFPLRTTGMADPQGAQSAGHAATQALREAWIRQR